MTQHGTPPPQNLPPQQTATNPVFDPSSSSLGALGFVREDVSYARSRADGAYAEAAKAHGRATDLLAVSSDHGHRLDHVEAWIAEQRTTKADIDKRRADEWSKIKVGLIAAAIGMVITLLGLGFSAYVAAIKVDDDDGTYQGE